MQLSVKTPRLTNKGFDAGNANHSPAIVTEFAENGSLADHLDCFGCFGTGVRTLRRLTQIVIARRCPRNRDLRPSTIVLEMSATVFRGTTRITLPRSQRCAVSVDGPILKSDGFSSGMPLFALFGGDLHFRPELTAE